MKSKVFIIFFLLCCLSCKTTFENFNKKSDRKKQEFVRENLNEFGGSDLWNFIYQLQKENVDLSIYNDLFKEKLEKVEFAFDFYVLSDLLSQNTENNAYLTKTINDKIELWDSGNWSEKMWKLISDNGFTISKPNYYSVRDGNKTYKFSEFMTDKINNSQLGRNPLLTVDFDVVFYEKGKLSQTVDTLRIKQIDYIRISESIKLFGNRGKDGMIKILTK
ncbi:hypothetical protein [Kordia jejudonensis]|uniref:hypothetical protein n=1 Tax=Kordia jejudonensis TaxID=1348245 RepID=UPI000629C2AF|nr:hypothetical protein [Kordia jejudonensis]